MHEVLNIGLFTSVDHPQANNRRTSWLVAALVPCLLLLSMSSVRYVSADEATEALSTSTAKTADQTAVDDMVDEYMDDEDDFEDSLAGDGSGAAVGTAPAKKSTSKRKKKATLKNQVVGFAPAANVTFGDDIDDEGGLLLGHAGCHVTT